MPFGSQRPLGQMAFLAFTTKTSNCPRFKLSLPKLKCIPPKRNKDMPFRKDKVLNIKPWSTTNSWWTDFNNLMDYFLQKQWRKCHYWKWWAIKINGDWLDTNPDANNKWNVIGSSSQTLAAPLQHNAAKKILRPIHILKFKDSQ